MFLPKYFQQRSCPELPLKDSFYLLPGPLRKEALALGGEKRVRGPEKQRLLV